MRASRNGYFDLISGRTRGPVAGLLRAGLHGLSLVYGVVVALRNAWYSTIRRAALRVRRPVISIGNLTVGGTGKTPTAVWVARHLIGRGLRVAILTRGYRPRPPPDQSPLTSEGGRGSPFGSIQGGRAESDEARLLARLCPEATVIVDSDRTAAAERAVSGGADVLILDDGFQHRRLARDLDVVLVDATLPLGFGRLLPRGLLREGPASLRRADLVIVTRSDALDEAGRAGLRADLDRLSGGKPVLACRHRAAGFVDLRGRPVPEVEADAMQAVLFAGIGRFSAFVRTAEGLGVRVLAAYEFPDHHEYSAEEVEELPRVAAHLDANVLLTTEKDAVRLAGRWTDAMVPLMALRVEVEFAPEDDMMLREAINRLAPRVDQPDTPNS